MKEIFSSGGGTQSACIVALIVQGRLPKPDFCVIVDTERERSAVWEYHDAVIVPALASVGLEIHRVKKSRYATTDLFSTNDKNLLIPAFTNQTGDAGKLSNFCSFEWKKRVLTRFLRVEHGIATKDQMTWIGFSFDETKRIVSIMHGEDRDRIRLPLVHDVPLRREQAIKIVESMGWPTPPRSACWMCPNQGDSEWRDLKENYPADFQAAIDLEKEVQKKDPFAWLHKSCIPLEQVDFSQPDDLFSLCKSGNCMT